MIELLFILWLVTGTYITYTCITMFCSWLADCLHGMCSPYDK